MVDDQLLGRGIYDLGEVARLVHRTADEVEGWAKPAGSYGPLLIARERRLFSFYDLVTAVVTAELRARSVPLPRIRRARDYLAIDAKVDWPLAHYASLGRLANVGSDVFVRDWDDEWIDAGRGGQRAFPAVIKPLLHHLRFDAPNGMASSWNPSSSVVVDPRVQAGAPCVKGTRVPTEMLADLLAAGESPEDLARDYGLPPRAVRAALDFEHSLAA
jgi:uncharacterized protein (DUF433 family)